MRIVEVDKFFKVLYELENPVFKQHKKTAKTDPEYVNTPRFRIHSCDYNDERLMYLRALATGDNKDIQTLEDNCSVKRLFYRIERAAGAGERTLPRGLDKELPFNSVFYELEILEYISQFTEFNDVIQSVRANVDMSKVPGEGAWNVYMDKYTGEVEFSRRLTVPDLHIFCGLIYDREFVHDRFQKIEDQLKASNADILIGR